MDTLINISVLSSAPRERIEPLVQLAFGWFERVEDVCSRFDPASEALQFTHLVQEPVLVSTLLLHAVDFATKLAAATDGAFDPTIGGVLEHAGYATHYRTGRTVQSAVASRTTFRDVHVDLQQGTIRVDRPLVLDLNSVAKGLAIDLAGQALQSFENVCIEAGGDLFVKGNGPSGDGWHVGIQHPRIHGVLAHTLRVRDVAVCTSADTERGAHIFDALTGQPVADLASVTVVAPTAMAADGLSTAARILGRERGRALLDRHGVSGVFITPYGDVE